jgi:hypothetical protein
MQISKLTKTTKTVTLELEGEALTLTVRPYLMTPEVERRLNGLDGEDIIEELLQFFCEYVVEWDLELEPNSPLELKPDAISEHLPSSVVLWIWKEANTRTNPLGQTSTPKRKR